MARETWFDFLCLHTSFLRKGKGEHVWNGFHRFPQQPRRFEIRQSSRKLARTHKSGFANWLNNATYAAKCLTALLPLWPVVSFRGRMASSTPLQIGTGHFVYGAGHMLSFDLTQIGWGFGLKSGATEKRSLYHSQITSKCCDSQPWPGVQESKTGCDHCLGRRTYSPSPGQH